VCEELGGDQFNQRRLTLFAPPSERPNYDPPRVPFNSHSTSYMHIYYKL
jgi:hypothetical protein